MSGTDYTQTPNLRLFKPIYDMAPETWGDLLNSNADVLDNAISTLPAPPLPSGTVPPMDGAGSAGASTFYARADHAHPSDTSRLALSGGTMTGPLNWASTGTPTVRAAQDRTAEAVNVRDFGAVGDGTTDDTAAFQAAIATGHTLFVPRGHYIVGPITLNQGMFGEGQSTTVLQLPSGPTNVIFITQNDAGPSSIRDMTIDGSNRALYGIATPQPVAQQSGLRFERLEIRNIGWDPPGASVATALNCWVDSARLTSKQAFVVHDNYIHDILGAGISIGGTGHVVANNTLVHCGHSGIGAEILIDGVITGNTVNDTGFTIGQSSDGITGYNQTNQRVLIIGNTVENATNHGIHLGGGNIQLIGNKVNNVINGHGLFLQSAPNSAPTPTANGLVCGNEVDGVAVGSGIRCGWYSRVVVTGNTISNIGNPPATPNSSAPGILFIVSSDCICTDNIIFNVGNDGIAADTGINLLVSSNRIMTVTGRGINDLGLSTGMIAFGNIISGEGTPTAPAFAGTPPPWAPINSPTFTGTVTIPAGAAIAGYAPLASPIFTGTVGLPGATNTGVITGGTIANATIGTAGSPVTAVQSSGPVNMQAAAGQQMNNVVGADAGLTKSMFVQAGPLARWRWFWAVGAETGGNVGADFILQAYDDNGATTFQPFYITRSTGITYLRGAQIGAAGQQVGFYGVTPTTRQGVSGSRADPQQALANLLTALSTIGIINNLTTP